MRNHLGTHCRADPNKHGAFGPDWHPRQHAANSNRHGDPDDSSRDQLHQRFLLQRPMLGRVAISPTGHLNCHSDANHLPISTGSLSVDMIYPDPTLEITPSTGMMQVDGTVIDVAKSELGFLVLQVQADQINTDG